MKDGSFPLGLLMAASGFGFYLLVSSPLSEQDAFPLDDYLSGELLDAKKADPPGRSPGPSPIYLVEEVLSPRDPFSGEFSLSFPPPLP